MKRLLLAFAVATIISGAAQAQPAMSGHPATSGYNDAGQAYPGAQRPYRRLTGRFPEGSFPPGYRPTPLQETLARNGAAAVDNQHYNSWLKRNK
ncbi:hypothetical protein IC232_05080 [Microvirga sp. BT688]|uniref:hypothetical protein n=1 Tax=Microvirga sp. TaxID=1873136 RepID=UPI00168600F2|nr:hypothetical protein [Microvirga sp.]MBD2746071.1 hypothetical protein [Microvirga sp.]